MTKKLALSLFAGYGIEIEYMIVNQHNLNIQPIADRLLFDPKKGQLTEITVDNLAYSNELALHILELKTNGPCKNLNLLPKIFNQHICMLNAKLAQYDAVLMPTGAHPWMNPKKDFKMWPHEYSDIYQAYNNIFNCCGHGWCNVQSVHLNLPFANDEEFAKLHTAIRLLLPIIPALTASSPIIEQELSGHIDTRLFFYNQNQKKCPHITGQVIPECITSKQKYEEKVLNKIYQQISPYDENGLLQHEWLNSRGAIARFDRNAIEIRIMDTQESPLADLSIIALIVAVLKNLVYEEWITYEEQLKLQTDMLQEIYLGVIKQGSMFNISAESYLQAFNIQHACTARKLWHKIFNTVNQSKYKIDQQFLPPLQRILTYGNLSERILAFLNGNISKKQISKTYIKLIDCLKNNTIF